MNNHSDCQYAQYFKELNSHDIRDWVNAYFTAAIIGLIHEEAFLSLLILYKPTS